MKSSGPRPRSFRSSEKFRAWLSGHHSTETELIVRLFKVHAADRGMTYKQALDEALCFGWIDGVAGSFDDDSYTIRFTPRKPKSIWSMVNIARVAALQAAGRMTAAGSAAFARREESRSGVYAYENRKQELDAAYLKVFQAKKRAWAYFQKQAPWYQRTSTYWVMSAKREETRLKRLETLISSSAAGKPIPSLDRTPSKT